MQHVMREGQDWDLRKPPTLLKLALSIVGPNDMSRHRQTESGVAAQRHGLMNICGLRTGAVFDDMILCRP